MDVASLLHGIAVIADNKIEDKNSDMLPIKEALEEKNIPVLCYKEIPRESMIPAFTNVLFLILDWDFTDDVKEEDGARIGAYLKEESESELISFIKAFQQYTFSPIFIFSGKDIGGANGIQKTLEENHLWSTDKPNRIFLESKQKLTKDIVLKRIEEWFKNNPSTYVLKTLDNSIDKTKNQMFIELFNHFPYWANFVYESFKEDGPSYRYEFEDFLFRQLCTRYNYYEIDEDLLKMSSDFQCTSEDMIRVMEGERFIKYTDQNRPDIPYTGDVFVDRDENGNDVYLLNIRAQCDLMPRNDKLNVNPNLYLIAGIEVSEIIGASIRLKSGNKIRIGKDEFSIDEGSIKEINEILETKPDSIVLQSIDTILIDGKEYPLAKEAFKTINDAIVGANRKVRLSSGELIEKEKESIVTCINGKKAIRFEFDIIIRDYDSVKDKRIGRLLPPYITRVQQKCSKHIIREGVTRNPKEVFE